MILNFEMRALPSHTASASASTPSDVFEDTGMTGTSRIDSNLEMSMFHLLRASSILVSATIVGIPNSNVSKHRTRLFSRLVASATITMESLLPS